MPGARDVGERAFGVILAATRDSPRVEALASKGAARPVRKGTLQRDPSRRIRWTPATQHDIVPGHNHREGANVKKLLIGIAVIIVAVGGFIGFRYLQLKQLAAKYKDAKEIASASVAKDRSTWNSVMTHISSDTGHGHCNRSRNVS
jgi:hypothetical protein